MGPHVGAKLYSVKYDLIGCSLLADFNIIIVLLGQAVGYRTGLILIMSMDIESVYFESVTYLEIRLRGGGG